MNGFFNLSLPRRLKVIYNILVLGLVSSIFISFKLWFGYREFPYAPIISSLNLGYEFHSVLVILLLVFLLTTLFVRARKTLFCLTLLVAIILVVLDVNRLQPWFYTYNGMLCLLCFYNGRVDNSNNYGSYFLMLQIMLASVYVSAGFNLLLDGSSEQLKEILFPLKKILSERHYYFLAQCIFLLPYTLILIGFTLLIGSLRYLAVTAALLIHIFILVLTFPALINYNYGLWLLNLCLLGILMLLFSGKIKETYFNPLILLQKPLFYLIVPGFISLPFMKYNGFLPHPVSCNFINWTNKNIVIKIHASDYDQLSLYQKCFCQPFSAEYVLNCSAWSLHELNVDCIDASPILLSLHEYLSSISANGVKETQLVSVQTSGILLNP